MGNELYMKIFVKLSTTLRQYLPGYDPEKGLEIDLDSGKEISALDLANQLGIPVGEIKFVMLNGRYQPMKTALQPNDRVAYFPAVGGG